MKRLALAAALLLAAGAFFALDLHHALALDRLKAAAAPLTAWRDAHPALAIAAFAALYVALTALALPVTALLTVAAGALFGVVAGTLIVSFASTAGATLAMLAARYVLRDAVRTRWPARLAAIDAGIAREGPFHLFALRLVPLFPFFAVNLAMGLTGIRARTFAWVSQLGMLPGTIVYVNQGTQLAALDSLSGLLSWPVLLSFAALGLLPLAARRAVAALRARRALARWPRPARVDHDLVVIGAGAAGLVAAYVAAAAKAKVALVEAGEMGGDCLNTGCVPSKALLRAASVCHAMRHAADLGLPAPAAADVDLGAVMDRVRARVAQVAPHDSVARYTALGVDCIAGHARLTSPWTVEVRPAGGGAPRTLATRGIVIATGARPALPPIPGLAEVAPLTSETVWSLRTLPRRLVVLGGGPIGCELAQAFARLGAQVTVVEAAPRLLPREDPEVGALMAERFAAEGIAVRTGCRAVAARPAADAPGAGVLDVLDVAPVAPVAPDPAAAARDARADAPAPASPPVALPFDRLLVAVGRTPRTEDLGLEALGIDRSPRGTLDLDAALRTRFPHITACGDVAGPWQFTHTASHQAWTAAVNALFGRFRALHVDGRVIPWTTFTEPEVARVGLSETEAAARGIACEVTVFALAGLDRAIAEGATAGFVKVLTVPGRDRLLGATVVGAHAGELVAELALAMRHGIGLGGVLATVHAYPTWAEANRRVAGEWRRRRVTAGQQRVLAAVQDWLRGDGSLATVLGALPGLLRRPLTAAAPPPPRT